MALNPICKMLHKTLQLYQISCVDIVLKMRKRSFFKTLLKILSYYNIIVSGFTFRRTIALNGVKGRKLRRL